ncbi:disulfide bond formation protein DsbA [Malaciobacter molluscorum]|uniref:DsbA family protein n=1 Tax=Malaciobacter molluscorum TaxID=1032072 RepID=UPI00100BF60A|nr:thioredoxin domain-containing protein [Malaciobacter molluscorum]RXJ95133.1 disulfide bond formation protein DsbA [Malaciobacter molluscorum]
MSLTTKTLLISSLLFSSIYANSLDDKIISFEKKRFSSNKRVEIKDLSISMKKELPLKGWYGFVIDVNAQIANKNLNAKDILFSNGEVVAPELVNIKTGKSFKDLMTPELTSIYYSKKRLIAGNDSAKDKLVVFSDPLCPFCIEYIPNVIEYVKKHDDIALYYYHFPLLQLHPASKTIVEAMLVAKQKGIKDVELKVYKANFAKQVDAEEKDKNKILKVFNKLLNTDIKLSELNNKAIDEEVFTDINMGENVMVEGTPTIFVNGKQDKTKLEYEMLGK